MGIFLTFLPIPDFFTLQELNLDFFVLTILLYGISVVIVYSLGIVCYVTIIVSGQAAHKMALRYVLIAFPLYDIKKKNLTNQNHFSDS